MGALEHEKFGRVSGAGKLNLPAQYRKALGLEQGGAVRIGLVDGEIRIRSVDTVMEQLGAKVRRVLEGDSVEQFLADKRADAARENEGE